MIPAARAMTAMLDRFEVRYKLERAIPAGEPRSDATIGFISRKTPAVNAAAVMTPAASIAIMTAADLSGRNTIAASAIGTAPIKTEILDRPLMRSPVYRRNKTAGRIRRIVNAGWITAGSTA